MTIQFNKDISIFLKIVLLFLILTGISISAIASEKDFIVVLDPGHGGKDHGAIDNGKREKDINLAVALKLGELIKKKLKNTKVVFTRDDDSFISLQGRADIANKSKGDLFISIHTNSVDTKNKNRSSIAGASVYTQGGHKDEANLEVAKRENSVIELENGYEQKYSGFDPNKVESYIIFEMAAKHNIAQSHRFAKNVQQNLVKHAHRKDRGVHQAGFWVLWATSMPSALVELDFICNPESANFISSKEGIDKLAEAIFEAVKDYEQTYRQNQRMMSNSRDTRLKSRSRDEETVNFAEVVYAGVDTSRELVEEENSTVTSSRTPRTDEKDLSHFNLQQTQAQNRARHANEGRRRRSAAAAAASHARDISVNHIEIIEESTGDQSIFETVELAEETFSEIEEPATVDKNKKDKKKKKEKNSSEGKKDTRKWVAEVNKSAQKWEKKSKGKISSEFMAAKSTSGTGKQKMKTTQHAGARKSLKSRN